MPESLSGRVIYIFLIIVAYEFGRFYAPDILSKLF